MDTNNLKNSKEKEKKPISHKKIIIAVVMICIAFFGSFLAYFVLQVALNTEAPIVIVVSGSMEPSIREGDLLFVMGTNPEYIKIGTAEDKNGDVIVFDARGLWAGAPEEPIVHRVVDKYLEGDTWYFRTKGDANSLPDQIPVPESRIIGVVIGGIPYIGWVKIVLTEYGLLIPLLVIISAFLVISIIRDIFQGDDEDRKKNNDKNQEDFEKQPPKTNKIN
ncbi:MAG: signal peptidase I [Promethearchaeota archaeon Loki_b31]|nr:MAG: signal peptidase I [Candidatus Lokiarchaeota archaeon Loki_b31]